MLNGCSDHASGRLGELVGYAAHRPPAREPGGAAAWGVWLRRALTFIFLLREQSSTLLLDEMRSLCEYHRQSQRHQCRRYAG